MKFNWRELGIDAASASGNKKTFCPQCRNQRSNKRDKSLSVNGETGLYLCHHCGWSGKAPEIGREFSRDQMQRAMKPKVFKKPTFEHKADPEDKTLAYFAGRGISAPVVRRNRIERVMRVFDREKGEEPCLAFPYFRNGELVNVQYRTADKRFKLEADCELVFYGLDDIVPDEPLFIVEGQIDKLSLEEAGYVNCVSVPNGANVSGSATWIESAADKLAQAKYFVLAGDNDAPGTKCMDEMARRLGVERCWRVEWPDGCKDANEVLTKLGRAELISALECASPLPINGIVEMCDLIPELEQLHREGFVGGVSTGWENLDPYYRPRRGECTIVTGAPGTGKSTFLDALLVNLASLHQWRFAIFSPEQEPLERHAANLLRVWRGKPFYEGKSHRMSWEDAADGIEQLTEYFKFLSPDEADLNIDGIIRLAQAAITRYGVEGLVIDPWNELEHTRPPHQTETEFIGDSLRRLRRFARMSDIHLWIMVHPKKLEKDKSGRYPVPTPYDLNGSSHWFNKADMILSLWRDKELENPPVEVHSQKVRFAENGEIGKCDLWWDRVSYRFADSPRDFTQLWESYQ